MIIGSRPILGPAPIHNLDPFTLAECQPEGSLGYMVLVGMGGRALTLCLEGPKIVLSGLVSAGGRKVLDREAVQTEIASWRTAIQGSLSLYPASADLLSYITIALADAPLFRLPPGKLCRRTTGRIVRELLQPGCLLEVTEFTPAGPRIMFQNGSELPFGLRIGRGGWVSIYDMDVSKTSETHQASRVQVVARSPASSGYPAGKRTEEAINQDLARVLEQFLRSFKQSAAEILGKKAGKIFSRSEQAARVKNPRAFPGSVTVETAAWALDFVSAVADRGPFFKRARLRALAAVHVSEMYGKEFDVLKRYGLAERVEQMYRTTTVNSRGRRL